MICKSGIQVQHVLKNGIGIKQTQQSKLITLKIKVYNLNHTKINSFQILK